MALSNYDVAHRWAYRKKGNGGSIFSESDGRLVSYSTTIGRIYDSRKGEFCIMDLNNFSNTTNRHQGCMLGAVSHIKKFKLPNYFSSYRQSGDDWKDCLPYYYMVALYLDIMKYKTAKSFDKYVSLEHYDEALEYLQWIDGSISKLLRTTNKKWYSMCGYSRGYYGYNSRSGGLHAEKEVNAVRKMIRAIQDGVTGGELVDLVCGKGTWEAYLDRTKGVRNARYMRKLNAMLGFETNSRINYYWPYGWRKGPKSKVCRIHNMWVGYVEGKLTINDVRKYRKQGNYIQVLLDIKRENFRKNCEIYEAKARIERKEKAMKRLEDYLNLSWKTDNYYGFNRTIFPNVYNGVTVEYKPYYDARHLTNEEYDNWAKMSNDERKAWVHELHTSLLAHYRELDEIEKLKNEDYVEYQFQREVSDKSAQDKERAKMLKKQGAEGWRTMYHEGLIADIPYSLNLDGLYYDGNVLMRTVTNGDGNVRVETSKGIKLSVEECRRLWRLVQLWHNNSKEFESGVSAHTITGSSWTISAYRNDKLYSGCHTIAYPEMEYIAKQLNFIS